MSYLAEYYLHIITIETRHSSNICSKRYLQVYVNHKCDSRFFTEATFVHFVILHNSTK